jgi:hypothetical protein
MGNSLTSYNFDTNGKFVSGIARSGIEGNSTIVGFYVSDFGQTSEYRYQARIVDSVLSTEIPNAELNVFFPPGMFLSGFEHYNKSTQDSYIVEEKIHYIITDGYNKKVGYIHYNDYNLAIASNIDEIKDNQFSCTTGEYLTKQYNTEKLVNSIRTVTHDYKCSTGVPRPIPSSDVGAAGPIGPQGLRGNPGSLGKPGLQGVPGLRGSVGPMGPRGSIGRTGSLGPRGLQGSTGIAGIAGNPGPSGADGPQGIKGLAFENEFSKLQLNITTILLFLMIVYVIIRISYFSTVFGTSGGDISNIITGGNIITDSGETAGGIINNTSDMIGGIISDTGNMLGDAIGGTTEIIGSVIGGTTRVLGGVMDNAVGGSMW